MGTLSLVLLAVLQTVNVGRTDQLHGALIDYYHVPLFAALTWCLLGLTSILASTPPRSRGRLVYGATLGIAAAIALLSEIAQIPGARDADLADLLRDMAGILALLCVAASFDAQPLFGLNWPRNARRTVLWSIAAALVLAAATPVADTALVHCQRLRRFPLITGFETPLECREVAIRKGRLDILPPPAQWRSAQGNSAARFTFDRANDLSGFTIPHPISRWEGYRYFRTDIYSELDTSVTIILRIYDFKHNSERKDRFECTLVILPGEQSFCIPLDDVRAAPAGRETEMNRIASIVVFAETSWSAFMLWFDSFRLSNDCSNQ